MIIDNKTLIMFTIMTAIFGAELSFAQAIEPVDKNAKVVQSAPEKAKPKGMPFRGKVSAINRETKTFILPGRKQDRVFQVTPKTKFIKNGKPAGFEDLIEGESVGGSAWVGIELIKTVISLRIGPKPDPSKKAEPKPETSEKP